MGKNKIAAYYPLGLRLKGRLALVVGGGYVAERKTKTLLKFGAKIRIISPSLVPALKRLAKSHKIIWLGRKIKPSDIRGADIVIAATSVTNVNRKVSQWAKKRGVLINVVDNIRLSSFISPAIFSKGKATVAIYTNGREPALSRDLKKFLKEKWNDFLSYRNRL